MLRVSKLRDAEYVLRDIAGGIEDYYLGRGEAPGVWAGRLPEHLGLSGVVEAEALRALIEGRDPTRGTALIRDDAKRTVRAFDVTLSPPKSVSLLWAFATAETSSGVSIAHVEAVAEALAFLDGRAGVTRQQSGGVRRRVATSGLAVATFVHRTSREGDPQLHSHCVIPNVVRRPDGSWVAIDGTPLYEWAKAAGSIYQEELRRRLSERLGVAWGPDRNGCREMLGFTERQLDCFSKRTGQIHHYQQAKGIEPADAKERMIADEKASVATRRAKDQSLTPERLAGRWQTEGTQVGLKTGRALEHHLRDAARGPVRGLAAQDVGRWFELLVDSEVGLCATDSRFGEAQVIARIAGLGAGQLTADQIEKITALFLRSDRVVRMIDRDPSGRTPPRWSTLAHRRLADRVLANLSTLRHRSGIALDPAAIEQVVADCPHLGDDQRRAVRVLGGAGPAVRAAIAPAGYGKTTMLRAAADAAGCSGRPVVALATTNQAVAELRRAGLNAMTVARFALDGCHLAGNSVVVVDELSQLPTAEADLVLSAVAACEGGQLWLVGDPLQAQPVRAGGLAPLIVELAERGRIPAATLTVNRRQADLVERQALAHYREGEIAASQQLRETAGLEHHAGNPELARQGMAEAVVDAISQHGPEEVVALAVTHTDCEDLADRVRARLAEQGVLSGPGIEGPGWNASRSYRAGDRVLLHTPVDTSDGRRLPNGTVGTVVSADRDGLNVRVDGHDKAVLLPRQFVGDRGRDGRPQLSHAWCRTIDGVQGGTWTEVHLLGTQALDRYRGYVGQSRARQGTHTWNTRPIDPADHGGRLVHSVDTPAGEVLTALRREPAKTFAAFDDPWQLAGRLERERNAHRAVLAGRPSDIGGQLRDAQRALAGASEHVKQAEERVTSLLGEVEATGRLRRLIPGRRSRQGEVERTLRTNEQDLEHYRDQVDRNTHHVGQLQAEDQASRHFDKAESWRHERIAELDRQLERHWTDVVLAAARAGDPYAYGPERLKQAHRILLDRTRTNPNVDLAEHNLADLERAVLTSRPAPAVGPNPVQERAATARRGAQWLELARNCEVQRGHGREPGIGL
ncbi:MAG TPA: MobF family relaxase [Acidimicrobiales bacterium]|nr:MobF family relaxase [Acidimicrobiales bacterium]